MNNRLVSLILVAVIGIILGLMVVSKKAQEPMLATMVDQQKEMIESLHRIEKHLEGQKEGFEGLAGLSKMLAGARQGQPQRPQRPQEDYTTVHDLDIKSSHIVGKKDAPITIVEFVDFECPFCARFHPPINQVLEEYPDKVNYVLKNFPLSFHPNAKPAAKAALAAGEQGKYGEMANLLLKNQKSLNDESYKKFAEDIGLDVKKFMKDYKERDAEWEKKIQEDMALGGKVGVRGTPTFFLNGRKTQARDFNSYKREIDKILSEKK